MQFDIQNFAQEEIKNYGDILDDAITQRAMAISGLSKATVYNDIVANHIAHQQEFFNAQSQIDKEIITDLFARLGRNMATPADMMIVRDFFHTC